MRKGGAFRLFGVERRTFPAVSFPRAATARQRETRIQTGARRWFENGVGTRGGSAAIRVAGTGRVQKSQGPGHRCVAKKRGERGTWSAETAGSDSRLKRLCHRGPGEPIGRGRLTYYNGTRGANGQPSLQTRQAMETKGLESVDADRSGGREGGIKTLNRVNARADAREAAGRRLQSIETRARPRPTVAFAGKTADSAMVL